jgi:hypothetical protein
MIGMNGKYGDILKRIKYPIIHSTIWVIGGLGIGAVPLMGQVITKD